MLGGVENNMALQYKKIMVAVCPICGWIHDYVETVNVEIMPKKCPACGDNASRAWQYEKGTLYHWILNDIRDTKSGKK